MLWKGWYNQWKCGWQTLSVIDCYRIKKGKAEIGVLNG